LFSCCNLIGVSQLIHPLFSCCNLIDVSQLILPQLGYIN
jgi:hypothetical protein